MERVLSLGLLTLGGIVAAVIFISNVLPAVARSSAAQERAAAQSRDMWKGELRLTHALSELDSAGVWRDLDADTYFGVWLWAKNVGAATIRDLEEMDVFIGKAGAFARIPHESDAGAAYPRWVAAVEGGGTWRPDKTLKITVRYVVPLTPATYTLRIVIPTGAGAAAVADF